MKPIVISFELADGSRCVDIIDYRDGTFGFKEFRRDAEDGGRWSLLADYSDVAFKTKDEAIAAARRAIAWFRCGA